MPQTVLVTGSSKGIGLEFVKQFAGSKNSPKHIFATCRSPDKSEGLKALASKHTNVHPLPLDICNDESIANCLKAVKSFLDPETLGLTMLINNGGVCYHEGSLFSAGLTRKSLMDHLNTNVVGSTLVSQAFVPLLRKAADKKSPMSVENAAIINISSDSGSISGDILEANNKEVEYLAQKATGICYRISKAGLNMGLKCLSLEVAADNILCLSFCPGWVQTDLGRVAEAEWGGPELTTQDSVSALLDTMSKMGEKDNGMYYHHDGRPIRY